MKKPFCRHLMKKINSRLVLEGGGQTFCALFWKQLKPKKMITREQLIAESIFCTERGTRFKVKHVQGDIIITAAYPYNEASNREEYAAEFLDFLNERNAYQIET